MQTTQMEKDLKMKSKVLQLLSFPTDSCEVESTRNPRRKPNIPKKAIPDKRNKTLKTPIRRKPNTIKKPKKAIPDKRNETLKAPIRRSRRRTKPVPSLPSAEDALIHSSGDSEPRPRVQFLDCSSDEYDEDRPGCLNYSEISNDM
jgi:hypothetical protein